MRFVLIIYIVSVWCESGKFSILHAVLLSGEGKSNFTLGYGENLYYYR